MKYKGWCAKTAGVLTAALLVQNIMGVGQFPVNAGTWNGDWLGNQLDQWINWKIEDEDEWDEEELDEDKTGGEKSGDNGRHSPSNVDWLKHSSSNAGQQQNLASSSEWLSMVPAGQTLASPSNLWSTGVGDLWNDWNGSLEFPGEGSEDYPYQIGSLAQLMGLSQLVAMGEDTEDVYFELTQDIDVGELELQNGNWNPIGWYQNKAELAGNVAHPFKGHFDGADHRIYGLKLVDPSKNLKNIGLFGAIDGGSVKDLTVEATDIYGVENVGILAGQITGNAVIQNVEVSGYAYSSEDAGGIAAEVTGTGSAVDGQVTIENCRARSIILNSEGTSGFVGGIAGNVQRAYLIDNVALTQNGDSNRIQGKGYVGGIAGRMRETSIYNSYVNGTIGGNGAKAVGGIVGKYESGNLMMARMAGDISRTNNGSASREGTFVGTRENRDNFTYGTERDSHVAYLYTNTAAKAQTIFGSTIDGDNSYTKAAHIGYWTDAERKYLTMAGRTETGCGDRYFYEELEDGIRYIITQKLGKEYTIDGYAKNLPFKIDHFAPGYMGEPIRGYLVDIPRIDARNANGTYDTDVAILTAMSETGSSYYREMDQTHVAAMAPGIAVTVTTAPKNTNENRYQMVMDVSEAGGVKPPTYRDEEGDDVPMNYVNGGAYSFIMPACDTELKAEYIKVTTKVTVDPADTTLQVIQTRSGDRKAPGIVTEVKNREGILIARYIDGVQDQSVEVQPVAVHAELNGNGQTVDRTVRWSVDDVNLVENRSESGYTTKDARILPNLNSSFIQDILNREVQAQADNQYREKIGDTIYTKYAVLTASTNPQTSVNNQAVYANCRVAVTFRIVDNTTVRVEGLNLNRTALTFTVTRHLTGMRANPAETISCSAPVVLEAAWNPIQPFLKNVSWTDQKSGGLLTLVPSGNYRQECSVAVCFDPSGKENPAWIQNVLNADNAKKAADSGAVLDGKASCTELITATSEDQTHGNVTVTCPVTIQFVTVDDTTLRVTGGGSGGSGGSGGGGGGSSSGGVSAAGTMTAGPGAAGTQLPSYVVKGTWLQDVAGLWIFTDQSRTYASEWAAVYNPYADTAAGQSAFDWFRFDADGHMVTGWYTDTDGNVYYLNPLSDGTRGRMMTGWNWIDGCCYYFQEDSDGNRGSLKRNFEAPDGRKSNGDGAWVLDGVVQHPVLL